jgi:hypothetical protein
MSAIVSLLSVLELDAEISSPEIWKLERLVSALAVLFKPLPTLALIFPIFLIPLLLAQSLRACQHLHDPQLNIFLRTPSIRRSPILLLQKDRRAEYLRRKNRKEFLRSRQACTNLPS